MVPFLNIFTFDISRILAEQTVRITGIKKVVNEDIKIHSVVTECPLQGRMFINRRL